MWKIFFDGLLEKWVVSEYSRSVPEEDLTYHWRRQAEMSCARRNGVMFWSEGEDLYE